MVQILFALAMIGVAIAFGVEASAYPATAARMPGLLAWVVGLLALGMLAEALLVRRREARATPAAGPIHATEAQEGGSIGRALLFLGLVVLYAATFQHAGFVLATVVFMGATLLLFRATRPLLSLVTVAATVAGIYAIFILFLRLPVPLWPAF